MKPTESMNEHLERALDDALTMTFPASDPVAVSVPAETASLPPAISPRRSQA